VGTFFGQGQSSEFHEADIIRARVQANLSEPGRIESIGGG
jgi:hypothetical protein